jgi:hypothetical protein
MGSSKVYLIRGFGTSSSPLGVVIVIGSREITSGGGTALAAQSQKGALRFWAAVDQRS